MPSFGLITYSGTDNVGDEIQSLAARRFLPRVDRLVDRESLAIVEAEGDERIWLIANGWYCYRPETCWPPSPALNPLLVSMHLSSQHRLADGRTAREAMLAGPSLNYFESHGPVGARDEATCAALRGLGVDAYFSGCMTMTLERPDVERDPNLVVFNDLPHAMVDHLLWRHVSRYFLLTRHGSWGATDPHARFAIAERLLRLYASASCVVTTRLHCALPCLAMGTPVLLVLLGNDPERINSLASFVHHCEAARLLADQIDYDISNPPPNPDRHLLYRERLSRRVEQFIATAA